MRRIDTATKAVDLFGAGKHGFKDGDPALAILATKLNAVFFNSVQEELANLIELSGQTLNPADNTQLYQAVQLLGATLLSKSVAGGGNVTLTTAESRNTIILLTGVLTANINMIVPAVGRQWIIVNNTTGAFTVTVKTAAGSGVAVTQGDALQLYCDATNVLRVGAAPGVIGQFSNLKASATGLSAAVAITADELIVENGSNQYQTLRAVSVTPTFANSGAGGLDVGAANSQAASTWYYLWVIWNGTTVSGLLSLSPTAPTMPSGYTHKVRVGAVRTDGTGNKYPLSFCQSGRSVQYKVAAGSNVAAIPAMATGAVGTWSTTAPTYASISVSAFVPPSASKISVVLNNQYTGGTAGAGAIAPNSGYAGPISSNPPPVMANTALWSISKTEFLLEGTSVYAATSGAMCMVNCFGWEDNL